MEEMLKTVIMVLVWLYSFLCFLVPFEVMSIENKINKIADDVQRIKNRPN